MSSARFADQEAYRPDDPEYPGNRPSMIFSPADLVTGAAGAAAGAETNQDFSQVASEMADRSIFPLSANSTSHG